MSLANQKRFLRVKFDLTGKCQLRCIMCHFSNPGFKVNSSEMSIKLLEKIAKELFPIAHDVTLSSSTEPLLANNLSYALDLCRRYNVPNFHFSTNAININKKIVEKIIDVQMPVLTISVDGSTKETYESIRPPAKWQKLMYAFELINQVKQIKKSELPALSVTSVLMKRNIKEMPSLVSLMNEKGVTQMNFLHIAIMGVPGIENESLINSPKFCNDILEEVRLIVNEVGMKAALPLPLAGNLIAPNKNIKGFRKFFNVVFKYRSKKSSLEPPSQSEFSIDEFINHKNKEFNLAVSRKKNHRRLCYFPWYYIHINPDGTVFPCGSWFEFSSFGSFSTDSFSNIWTGPEYKNLRKQIINRKFRNVCRKCAVSSMGRPDVASSFSILANLRNNDPSGIF